MQTSCLSLRIMQRSCSSKESSVIFDEPLKSGTYKLTMMFCCDLSLNHDDAYIHIDFNDGHFQMR